MPFRKIENGCQNLKVKSSAPPMHGSNPEQTFFLETSLSFLKKKSDSENIL